MALSVREIFEMACEIEHKGALFYRQAAQMHGSSAAAQTLLALADWEKDHEQTFAQMARDLADRGELHLPDSSEGKVRFFLRAIAGDKVFGLSGDPLEWLGEAQSIDDVLGTALRMEKDTIALYMGLKNGLPERLQRQALEAIIEEETDHVHLLGELMEG